MMAGLLRRLALGPDADEFRRHYAKYHTSKTRLERMYHSWRCQRICQLRGASIPVSAHLEGRIYFPHGLAGIFISKDAVIGAETVIFQQVTVGSNTLPDAKHGGSPVIGGHVYLGAGAKVIGGVTVGDNCRIGANCVVFEDLPDNATAVLPHPRVILRDAPRDNRFVRKESSPGES